MKTDPRPDDRATNAQDDSYNSHRDLKFNSVKLVRPSTPSRGEKHRKFFPFLRESQFRSLPSKQPQT